MKLAILGITALLACGQTTADWREQLKKARSAGTEAAYLEIEKSLDQALSSQAENVKAVLYRGATKMERAGWYAQQSKFGPANTVMAEAFADLDRAVQMQPQDLEVRMMRGSIYSSLPQFMKKSALGKQDLEVALRHPDLPENRRPEVQALIQRATSLMGKPDRFPKVDASVSPLLVAATVTGTGSVQWIVDAMKGQPGLLAHHILNSSDKPGMTVILTWWKDKAAVNDFFYGPIHQGMIDQGYRTEAVNNVTATQVGIEVFAPLPGGTVIGGGLTPEALRKQ